MAITYKSRTHLNEVRRLIFFIEKLTCSISFGAVSQLFLMVYLDRRTVVPVEVSLNFLFLHQINADLGHFFPFLNHLHTRRILFISSSCIVQPRVGRLTHLASSTAIGHPGLDVVAQAAGAARVLGGPVRGAVEGLAGR